ncbi:uncharacterized protein UBRO2_00184 [Ustilago bromivora]|uniref:Uncharacterized protein n=1 Tax=Ustilago bromivora TaxID=307758 RepID=A0A8H8QGE4_9BASI|nr:uncharacterized protein UBRO2_00184 [Ustilago bromivora]
MPSSSPSVTVLFPAAGDESVFNPVSSFFSSLLPVVYAEEAPSEDNESEDNESEEESEEEDEEDEASRRPKGLRLPCFTSLGTAED